MRAHGSFASEYSNSVSPAFVPLARAGTTAYFGAGRAMHKLCRKKHSNRDRGLSDGSFGERQQRQVRTYVLRSQAGLDGLRKQKRLPERQKSSNLIPAV